MQLLPFLSIPFNVEHVSDGPGHRQRASVGVVVHHPQSPWLEAAADLHPRHRSSDAPAFATDVVSVSVSASAKAQTAHGLVPAMVSVTEAPHRPEVVRVPSPCPWL